MPLTPIDVQQKTFGTALRGYDLDEVDDFLDDVVTALKDYEQRVRDAQERIGTLEMEMTDRGDAEGAIARALVAAQRSADSIVAEAKAEAEQVIAEARSEATQMTQARDDERRSAETEIDRIRGLVADLRTRVVGLTGALGGTLDETEAALDEAVQQLESPDDSLVEDATPASPASEARHAAVEPQWPDTAPPADATGTGHADDDDDGTGEEDVADQPAHADWTTPATDPDGQADETFTSTDWATADTDDSDESEEEQDPGHASRPWEVG